MQHSKCNNWKGSVKNLVQLLQESLCDRPFFVDQEDFEEIRYKLIIDPTEDDSSRRLIMEFHLLQPNEAKTLVGSDFPDDGDLQRVRLPNGHLLSIGIQFDPLFMYCSVLT